MIYGLDGIVHSSKGNQLKWMEKDDWYKVDYLGYEALAEVVISRLLQYTNVTNFLLYTYEKVFYKGKLESACVSRHFLNEDEELITIEKLLLQMYGVSISKEIVGLDIEDKIKTVVDMVEHVTGLTGFGEYLTLLLEVDTFFLNEDRHMHNIAVIRNEEKQYRFCPIFDNGAGLFSDVRQDYPLEMELEKGYRLIEAKPFHRSFDEQMDVAERLYGQQFEIYFTKKMIAEIVEVYALDYDKKIINRVQDILYTQYRKYEYMRKVE